MARFFQDGQTVLFQGDSITDCGRLFAGEGALGDGYVKKVVEMYQSAYPGNNVKFVNKGVSGARIPDLIVRYMDDIFDIEPDFLSIFIGINDTWRRYDSNDPSTVDAFRDHYDYLLNMVKRNLPDTKIMLIEPFVLNSLPDRATWREDLDPKIQVVREMANKYADYYLPLDGLFHSLCTAKGYSYEQLAPDGVHPSDVGHDIIARNILKTIGEIF